MAEELEGVWSMLTLTEEERDTANTEGLRVDGGLTENEPWLVSLLITRRPFNRDAMLGMMRTVWRILKKKDKDRVLSGAPWSFDKQLLDLMEYDGGLRVSDYVFKEAAFWVKVYGFPLNLMKEGIADHMGRKMGRLIEVDCNNG
ncbi:hypothetical protein DITRI_Ditri13aG0071600 [Diplodiscus trichospermus]